MRKVKLSIIITALAFLIAGCKKADVVERNIEMYNYDGKTDELKLDNEFLELRFIPNTAGVILKDKATGAVWSTNPENADDDPAADGITKQLMKSQLTVAYADSKGVGMTLNSFKYSVDKGMYQYELVDNGIEVSYTIGDIIQIILVPNALPDWRMTEITEKMDDTGKRLMKDNYRLYDINKLLPSDDKEALLESYPTLAEEKIWILRNTMQDFIKKKMEKALADAGYTEDDYREDMERYGIYTEDEKPVFNVTLRYELDGDSLIVSVPFDRVSYEDEYPITQLNVLPFFAAGSTDDNGYMLVPDGSGALIYFNNGRETQLPYNVNVYGWDECLYRDMIYNDDKAALPVFGIKKNENTLLCVIEEGASYARIGADVSGRNCSYNSVSASFSMIHSASMDISAKSQRTVILYENGLPEGERIVERFTPCKEDGYVGMAKEYRGYLEKKYPSLIKGLSDGGVPISVEIIGAVDKVQTRFGLPFDLPLKLTTYKEAKSMVSDFSDMGWKNVQIKLMGWFNQGVQHSVPAKVKPVSKLGSDKDMIDLVSAAKNNGFDFYAEGDFMFARGKSMFDGFNLDRDTARYVSRERVETYPYSFVWFGEQKWGKLSYLVRPDCMMDLIDGFVGKISKYGVDSIAFRSIGSRLAADYNEKRRTSREKSMNMQSAKLSELDDKDIKTMISTGNIYAAAFADFITDGPLTDQGFGITDVAVPFYGMVLHGLVPYTGKAVNLVEDYRLHLVKTVESGAGLSFSFMAEETAVLQETNYHQFYSNEYSKWISDADALYKQFVADFTGLYNIKINGHEILDKNIAVTIYEDGTKVYTNTNSFDYDYQGITIPALGYKVVR